MSDKTDPSAQDAATIKAAFGPEASTEVKDGLQFPSAEPPLTPREAAVLQQIDAEADVTLAEQEQELERGQEAIYEVAARAVEDVSDDPDAAADALAAALGDLDSERASDLAWAAAQAYIGWEDEDLEALEDEDLAAIEGLAGEILAEAESRYTQALQEQQRENLQAELPRLQRERELQVGIANTDFALERNLSPDEAAERLERIRQNWFSETGRDLNQYLNAPDFNPDDYATILRLEGALDQAVRVADAERDFKQRMLDSQTTDISAGLERLGPNGWQKMYETRLGPTSQERMNQLVAKEVFPSEVKEDVYADVILPDATDVKSGFTMDGKPADIDTVSGARERWAQEREERVARDRALMGLRKGN